MKPRNIRLSLFAGLVLAFTVSLFAQTDNAKADAHRLKLNAKTCEANGIAKADCTQQEVDAAVAAAAAEKPARVLPGGTIYATRDAFKDAVPLKRYLAEEEARQLNEDAAMLNREFVNATKAKRTEACAVFGKVC